MRSNLISREAEITEMTVGAYGSSRMTYNALAFALAGNDRIYDAGKLKEQNHVHVVYDVAQKFPEQQLAEVLKPTQTDLRQVHAAPNEFTYVQTAKGVEFQLSNMSNAESGDINASVLRQLLKEWDHMACHGGAGNEGFIGHSRATQTAGGALTFASLTSQLVAAVSRLKPIVDLTSDNLSGLTLAYSGKIADILDVYETGAEITNREKLEKQFPGMVMIEIPSNIYPATAAGKFLLVATQLVTLHQASTPQVWATEAGKYGMSTDTLFIYESAGVEVEEQGAIQETSFT